MESSVFTFEHFKLNKQLLNAVAEMGFQEPTEIQQKAIPLILEGHDVVGVAQTGTGKTAAFMLPTLMKIKYAQGDTPRAVVLCPTRELATQIAEMSKQLAAYTDLRIVAVYGGVGMKAQAEQLSQGCDILVATPGRLMDLYKSQHLILKNLKILILDEADKMMDMGFMPQLRSFFEVIPRKRQNLLFSATMPEKVQHLMEEFLEAPLQVTVSPPKLTADNVSQVKYALPNIASKAAFLMHLLQDETHFKRVIVFTRTRKTAENIYRFLCRKLAEETIRVIHANKAQSTRLNAIKEFNEGNIRVLVATDVASRGIDISEVTHVINFEVPVVYEDYVHRIGRTGRAKHIGESITFFDPSEDFHVQCIESIVKNVIPIGEFPEGYEFIPTSFEESQAMARIVDKQKKAQNPDYQGAFHEKKYKKPSNKKNKQKNNKVKSNLKRKK
ncbi:MAG: DEAD/DEAH box helicase [Cytophagales bacterium]|nr:MAG: DEAD/DEAH box helicase [Cytophagales bacterium]